MISSSTRRNRSRGRFAALMAAAFITLVTTVVSTTTPRRQEQNASSAQSDEELARVGEETTETVCSECHDIQNVTGVRRTAKGWNDMVVAMAARGANGTDDQFAIIKRYLTRYYGIVLVNTASAEELSAVLGLSSKDAVAIVDYRAANGKFADAEALAKVPGIDRSKIDAQPDALRFE